MKFGINLAYQEFIRQFILSSETIRKNLRRLRKVWELNKWVPYEMSETDKLEKIIRKF